jgi:hypothetical protein
VAVTLEVLQKLIASVAARLQDAEERLAELEETRYEVELRLTALEAKARAPRS